MVYANDQWVQLPVADIFDTTMMLLALASAKEMYDKGEERIKDFKKSYGEFYSPSAKDMQWYADLFSPDEVLSDLYNKGIDPLRSPEGRAMVNKWINSRPIGEFNARKQLAENIRTYLKNYAELERLGKLDKNREAWELLQIPGFEGSSVADWDFSKNGMFDRLSPSSTNSLYEDTNPWFNKYKPEVIMRANKDANGNYIPDPNGQYDVIGITDDRIRQALNTNLVDYISTGNGAWQYELSRRQLQAEGNESPSQQEIIDRLKDNIVSANNSVLYRTEQENPEYKSRREFSQKLTLQRELNQFTAGQNALDRQQKERLHNEGVALELAKLGIDVNDPANAGKSLTSLVAAAAGRDSKGIVHYSQSVAQAGINQFLVGRSDLDLSNTESVFKAAKRGQDAMLGQLFRNVPGLLAEAGGNDPWKLSSKRRWDFILQSGYNTFKENFIKAFSLSATVTPDSAIAYISGRGARIGKDGWVLDHTLKNSGMLVTADLILRNTLNFYGFPTYGGGNGSPVDTTVGAPTQYRPTGRVITIIDKLNRRALYYELATKGSSTKDGIVYYKLYNTSSPKDVAGPTMWTTNTVDNMRSADAERAVLGAGSDVLSGAIQTLSW